MRTHEEQFYILINYLRNYKDADFDSSDFDCCADQDSAILWAADEIERLNKEVDNCIVFGTGGI